MRNAVLPGILAVGLTALHAAPVLAHTQFALGGASLAAGWMLAMRARGLAPRVAGLWLLAVG